MPNGQYVWAAGMLRTRLILLVLWKKEQQDIRVGKGVKEMKGDMKVESLKRERKCFNLQRSNCDYAAVSPAPLIK